METIYGLLIIAAVIAMIYLAGSWNTSDADHYMGFENLRPPRKRKAPDGDEDAKKE
ncbi:hypothetical protein LHFGNBLO_000749 [Mesorhizobium sp. AR10]|uniref:hypothetical protein n=1 Tax=Mesorhizobium sp. AR10 TaxID=2865839 RepID=UPI00215EA3C0|nr:hypothetical protein [Mesorhizobium sp. AR10]UVK39386.1 hypothetical protein LHFGNBLO_000749 [Mesorhizobium sp. AR10]